MIKYVVASVAIMLAVTPVQAEEMIKEKIAVGCVEKDVAKTAVGEMAKYVSLINNKSEDKANFVEDCEVFMEGDPVVVLEKPEGEDLIKAQRPAQMKSYWLPAAALGKAEATKTAEAEKK